jgi:hypothetical protein
MDSPPSSLPPRAPAPPGTSRIQHTPSGIGQSAPPAARSAPPSVEPPPVRLDESSGPTTTDPVQKIKMFGKEKRHEEQWSRSPNTTGQGAIHVKTFHCKLTEDALNYMDQVINEWLDSHPQYEVKFVNATIGTFTGKLKEPALICQVWV